jgi:hypothetical protein
MSITRMKITRMLIIWLVLSSPLLALDLLQRTGTNAPTALKPGQFGYDLTNRNLYIGGSSSNPVLVGTAGAASTSFVHAAVASRLTTNAANIGFLVDSTGTNLLWVVNGITNQVNLTPLP